MNKYAQVAINTVNFINKNGGNPILIWLKEANYIFGEYKASAMKGCPRAAFLGLCEEGLVKGIPCGNYTKSKKNKEYAIEAVKFLKENSADNLTPKKLWTRITFNEKTHNSQMDIVYELFKRGYIV